MFSNVDCKKKNNNTLENNNNKSYSSCFAKITIFWSIKVDFSIEILIFVYFRSHRHEPGVKTKIFHPRKTGSTPLVNNYRRFELFTSYWLDMDTCKRITISTANSLNSNSNSSMYSLIAVFKEVYAWRSSFFFVSHWMDSLSLRFCEANI